MISTVIGMSWYLYRQKRPAIFTMVIAGAAIGYLILFLVVNRQSIYLGSDFSLTADVSSIVVTPGTAAPATATTLVFINVRRELFIMV